MNTVFVPDRDVVRSILARYSAQLAPGSLDRLGRAWTLEMRYMSRNRAEREIVGRLRSAEHGHHVLTPIPAPRDRR